MRLRLLAVASGIASVTAGVAWLSPQVGLIVGGLAVGAVGLLWDDGKP